MPNFYESVIQRDPRFHDPDAIRDMKLLFPQFRALITQLIAELKANAQTFQVIETFRSSERQHELYLEHATQLDVVGTHHFGLACDLARVIGRRINWEPNAYGLMGHLAEQKRLTWGGRWRSGDFVHLQYVTVEQQPALFAGTWYPT